MRASAGAEKSHSALHPEKPWFGISGRGFDSRHLHHFAVGHPSTTARHTQRAARSIWAALVVLAAVTALAAVAALASLTAPAARAALAARSADFAQNCVSR